MLKCFMFWPSSAQGNRPYASTTHQTVYKLVTSSLQNVAFCPFYFQSLAHSLAEAFSTTPLRSYCSALFAQNTGGGYIPHNLPLVFNALRTLARATSGLPTVTAARAEACCPGAAPLQPVVVRLELPSSPRWSPVVFQRKMPSIPFLFILLLDSSRPNEGGTPPPLVRRGFRHGLWPRVEGMMVLLLELVLEFQAASSALAARGNTDQAPTCSSAHTSLNWDR
jgi:hypothetical protein